MTRPFCVCVPARNEVDHIGTLIEALAAQTIASTIRVALCANNCSDATADVARAVARRFGNIALAVDERSFDAPAAHAGSARRGAMDLGVEMLQDDRGLLISTDADCRPPPGWIAANLAAAADDHILGGRIDLDPQADAPIGILRLRARFDRYWQQVREIEDGLDPRPWDPPPRHGDHTGASLALTAALYRRAGGVPLIATGEDRALVDAAVAVGGRLLHPPGVWIWVSPRTDGRAAGGMADVMRAWADAADEGAAVHVPHFDQWRSRAAWRRDRRVRGLGRELILAERRLAPMICDMALPE
ncbi:glycosyltransferase [Sphingomonas sanxanigenens]|uniref:Glycosyltransferase 2-like domain-containing protein n=1 Tax=Sphingomonas sanxanigenens DSM 19645 = NX02 TaxID=1123269 RepID=W0AHC7_9SPHN|nr:glycosyltransferase [Sphingomonas sanxanigenens]AHE55952.1 hypothetical protein NX02_21605 [Sphingomonas sanxanigenens DSM 19645 = NX02]